MQEFGKAKFPGAIARGDEKQAGKKPDNAFLRRHSDNPLTGFPRFHDRIARLAVTWMEYFSNVHRRKLTLYPPPIPETFRQIHPPLSFKLLPPGYAKLVSRLFTKFREDIRMEGFKDCFLKMDSSFQLYYTIILNRSSF